MDKVGFLRQAYTKQLLQYKAGCYNGENWHFPQRWVVAEVGSIWVRPEDGSPGFSVTIDELKAELATREHIPDKKEKRTLRQTRARQGR